MLVENSDTEILIVLTNGDVPVYDYEKWQDIEFD